MMVAARFDRLAPMRFRSLFWAGHNAVRQVVLAGDAGRLATGPHCSQWFFSPFIGPARLPSTPVQERTIKASDQAAQGKRKDRDECRR